VLAYGILMRERLLLRGFTRRIDFAIFLFLRLISHSKRWLGLSKHTLFYSWLHLPVVLSSGVRSKTPPEGYSAFVSYESSLCKTAIEHPRVPFSNASLVNHIAPFGQVLG